MVLCHKLSHINSNFGYTQNFCKLQKAKEFPTDPGQFKCVTRETRYHVLITESLELSSRISPKT